LVLPSLRTFLCLVVKEHVQITVSDSEFVY
jgi:hypothetical protein